MMRVQMLDDTEVDEAVSVLSEAFRDYPVMRYVIGNAGVDYDERLRAMMNFFAMARIHRAELLVGIPGEDGKLAACALVSIPDGRNSPDEVMRLRGLLWEKLGSDAQRRYEAYGKACQPFAMEEPHMHVNVIGVRRQFQGRGLGRLLLEYIHKTSAESNASRGVTLSTEDPNNVALYEKFGYVQTGHARVSDSLETWAFFRPN